MNNLTIASLTEQFKTTNNRRKKFTNSTQTVNN